MISTLMVPYWVWNEKTKAHVLVSAGSANVESKHVFETERTEYSGKKQNKNQITCVHS